MDIINNKSIPTLKSVTTLVPTIKPNELSLKGQELTIEVSDPENPGKTKRVLTQEAEQLVWGAAKNLRENVTKKDTNGETVEDFIVNAMKNAGLVTEETISHRPKSVQSLHDKIKTFLIENPDKTLTDAILDVRDAVGVRTVPKSSNIAEHPEVKELLEKGDIKSALNKAVEIESDFVLEGLKGIIDKMAAGTSDIIITRLSNYMGEDGIPYFTESQLNKLKSYAADKGIDLPIESRITNAADRASIKDVYNKNASTKIRKSGYTAFQMNFVTKNGDVFEWQYRGDEVNIFGEGEHVPYDLRTGKDIIGEHTELKPLYEPMKELLTDKTKMPDDLYKEYEAYLTAHYKYLRLVELGFEKPGNPPKLPQGIDARLRAENLEILHKYADDLKNGKISQEEALKRYNQELIPNTKDNVTTESYKEKMLNNKNNYSIDRYEVTKRLGDHTKSTLFKACQDSKGELKNNLVSLVEVLRLKGLNDQSITKFIERFKNEDGTIDSDVFINLNKFINDYSIYKSSENQISQHTFDLYTSMPLKEGQKTVDESFMPKYIELIKKHYELPPAIFKEISDLLPQINEDKRAEIFDYMLDFTKKITINSNKQSLITIKELPSILKSIIDKNGLIDENSANLVSNLSQASVLKEDIVGIVNSAKDVSTGRIDNETSEFLNQIIDKYKNETLNPAPVNKVMIQIIKSVKIQTPNPDGKGNIFVTNKDLMNKFIELYDTLPKSVNENYNILKLYKTATVLNSIKKKDSSIDIAKENLAKSLIRNKFTLDSISEVLTRSSDKDGKLMTNKVNAFVKNYNGLSKEDKINLVSVDVKLEAGILRQTMVFKDGSKRVFDINPYNVNNLNGYDLSTKQKQRGRQNTLYTKLKDTKRGKTSKITTKNGAVTSEVTIIQDKGGNKVGTEYISPASVGKGVLDVRFRDNNGNTHIMSGAERDINGNITITKDFTSTNGTRTQYDYSEKPNGSNESKYIITDNQGKVLLEETRSFEVVDDNHFVSTINGKRYEMNIDEFNVLTVINDKGKKVRFDLDKFTNDKYERFKELLKQIPGHEFFNMAKVEFAGLDTMQGYNARYMQNTNGIEMGPDHNIISTFFHEFGHNKDWKINSNDTQNSIRFTDKEFLQIYERERKAFINEFPNLQRDFVSYFVSLDNATSRANQSPSEVIAETNNILSTPYQGKGIEFRKYYLQRYFPETIAYLAKKLNPDVYNN